MKAKTKLTSVARVPVGTNQNSLIAGPRGPGLVSACNYSSYDRKVKLYTRI